jgi:hypothetical protein
MLLIYQNAAAREAIMADLDTVMAEVDDIMKELTESGEWVGGEGLAMSGTRTVKVRDGVPAITDGPFLEAKEFLAGYCVIDVDGIDRATEIAQRWPDARYCAMEIRPIIMEPEV